MYTSAGILDPWPILRIFCSDSQASETWLFVGILNSILFFVFFSILSYFIILMMGLVFPFSKKKERKKKVKFDPNFDEAELVGDMRFIIIECTVLFFICSFTITVISYKL